MIAVTMSDEHAPQRAATKRSRDRLNVRRNADAGIDQRRLRSVDQPRIVSRAGHRGRIERRQMEHKHYCGIGLLDYRAIGLFQIIH
jgi:hypothetical protein